MAAFCAGAGIAHYLPLREKTRRYSRSRRTFRLPLFPGYLFARLSPEERRELTLFGHVLRYFPSKHEMRLLRQLVQVRRALRIAPEMSTAERLSRGQRVRIARGPFSGIQGRVKSLRSPTRVFLDVEMMEQAAVLQVDRDCLEKL